MRYENVNGYMVGVSPTSNRQRSRFNLNRHALMPAPQPIVLCGCKLCRETRGEIADESAEHRAEVQQLYTMNQIRKRLGLPAILTDI